MTTQELKSRITTRFSGYGHYKVTIEYRGKEYSCITTNMSAIDRIGDDEVRLKDWYPTEKQALLALWDECKLANNLN